MGTRKLSSRAVLAGWTRLHDVSVFENNGFRVSTRIRLFGGFKTIHPGDAVSVSGFTGCVGTEG